MDNNFIYWYDLTTFQSGPLGELMRRTCSLVLCHQEMYKDQYGEFLCGFWGLGWLAWILVYWASYLSQTTRWDFFEPCPCEKDNASFFLLVFRKLVVIFLLKKSWISCKLTQRLMYFSLCLELVGLTPGGVLNVSLGGEVRHGPSYPDPV